MFLDERSSDEPTDKSGIRPDEISSTEEAPREIVAINDSDYFAIMQWDDDGGKPVDIVYVVLAHSLCNRGRRGVTRE